MSEKLKQFLRPRIILPTVVVLVVVALAVSLVLPTKVEEPVEAPLPTHEGQITILENGDAQMTFTTTATTVQFDNLYKTALENLGENEFKTMFHQDIQSEYETLMGLDISISDSEIGTGENGEFTISIDATASQVGVYNSTSGLWEINIRPREENAGGAEYMLAQMMFAQMLLKVQLEETQLEFESSLPIKLPSNSTIMNKDNLSASKWRIEFGGGTYREASLSVNEDQREVVLTEKIVVTDQTPELTQEAYDNFHNYRAFTIEYDLSGQVSMSARAAGASGEERSPGWTDWSRSWTRNFSRTFTDNFHGETDSVTADLDVYANPSFGFTFYIGWDFEWELDWPPLQLQWFRTYVEFSPGLVLDVDADITGNFSDTWVRNITSWSRWVTVSILGVPVPIELRVDLDAGAEASADGDFHFDAALDAETSLRLGVEYVGSWGPIYEWGDENILYSGPNIEVGAAATIKPFVELKVGAYVCGTAGPFIFLKPSATASLTAGDTNTWSIDAGFDIGAGVGFGELGDWLPLDDWRTTLDNWSTNLVSGTWRENNTAPTLTLENAPPAEASAGTTFTYEVTYTDADGDAPAYIRCYIDGEVENMSYVSGDYATGARYRYTWATGASDIGSHNYRFEAQDGQATAKLPSSGTYSGPTLTLPWEGIATGYTHSLGLSTYGTLWKWGADYPLTSILGTKSPIQVGTATNWENISSGSAHALGLRSNGTLWAWGTNYYGELGQGNTTDKTSPVQVGTATNWTAISAGLNHSLGLRSDGTLRAWGRNLSGQLGLGDNTNRTSSVQVGTATNWTAISAGHGHSLAIRSDGSLWAWGSNTYGELGLGDTTDRTSPVQVGTATNWTAISAGSSHSLGLRSDGTLWAWGHNGWGELGVGDTAKRTSPVQVGTATNWATITAGWDHSFAIRSDGTLWAWGGNWEGQLGLGDTTDRTSPVQVGTATNWSAASGGLSHSLGLHSDNTLWSWGYNLFGQLGHGDTTDRLYPDQAG